MRLPAKLLLAFAFCGLLPLVAVAYGTYATAERVSRAQIVQGLRAIADDKATRIETELAGQEANVAAHAQGLDLGASPARIERSMIIARDAGGFSDALLVDARGRVLVSLAGRFDREQVGRGEGEYTDVGRIWRATRDLLQTQVSDFRTDGQGRPKAYIAAPVLHRGRFGAAVLFELSSELVDRLAADRTGLGSSGEIVLAAAQDTGAVPIAALRHAPGAEFRLALPHDSVAALAARGGHGTGTAVNYRGHRVLATWRYLPSVRWGLVVQRDEAEALAPLRDLRRRAILVALAVLVPLGGIALLLGRRLSGRVRRLSGSARAIAGGAYETRIPVRDSGDELDELGGSFNDMAEALEADIEQRKIVEAQLAHRALHDPLTGLPNRTLLLDRAGLALTRLGREGGAVGVIFLDLDGFKNVNDGFGHAAGDALLVEVSRRLLDTVRTVDTVARFGGDEFVVLCPALADERDAVLVTERLLRALGEPVEHGEQSFIVGASAGVAVATDVATPPENLLRDADTALYRAKERVPGACELFDERLREDVQSRLRLEGELRRAIAQEQFQIALQPVVTLEDGRVAGFEALLRWHHPERGVVAPLDFIPVAEQTGLIVPIGTWVLEEACRAAVALRSGSSGRPGPGPWMSVNLSARQLARPDLPQVVADALARTGLPATALVLEITETMLVRDREHAATTLQALRDLGVVIALDDFGTGYASLGNLKRFPVDVVKIDRSFVRGLGETPDDEAIVSAVLAMSRALGLKVVAEGVETAEHVGALMALDCVFGQGYHFSRPVPAAEAARLLGRRTAVGA